MTNEEQPLTEIQKLIIRVLPPEEYGEDSNVEELYNRVTDMEKEVAELKEKNNNVIETITQQFEAYPMLPNEKKMWLEYLESLKITDK